MNKHQAVSFGDWSVRWVCSGTPGMSSQRSCRAVPPWLWAGHSPGTQLLTGKSRFLWILLLHSPRKHRAQHHRKTLLTITLLPQTKPALASRNDASKKWCELVTQKLDQHDGDRQSETQIKSQTQINFSFIFLYTSATKHLAKVALKVAAGNYIVWKAENILYGEILNA